MKDSKSKLAEIMDFILLGAVTFIAAALFLRTALPFTASIFGAIAVTFSVLALFAARCFRQRKSRESDKLFEQTLSSLSFASENEKLEYFREILSSAFEVQVKDGFLQVNNTRLYCLFLPQSVIAAELCRIHEECAAAKEKAVIMISAPLDKAQAQYIEGSGLIKVLPEEKLKGLILCKPLAAKKPPKQKGKLKRILKVATDRALFRRYLFSGVLLLGSSYLLPRSPLYIACGALCITMALICLVLPLLRSKSHS